VPAAPAANELATRSSLTIRSSGRAKNARRLTQALEGREFSVCGRAQRHVAFASLAALLCSVVHLAGLRVRVVGAKGWLSRVVRACCAFVFSGGAGARVVAVCSSSPGGRHSCAGHNRLRIAGHHKQRYRFFERHRNGAAVLTIRSSGRRSIAFVLPNVAAGAAYLKR